MYASHVHLASNCLFRTSYDFNKVDDTDFEPAEIDNTEAVIVAFYEQLLATTMRLVEVRTIGMVFDALGAPGIWSEGLPIKLSEVSATGTRVITGQPLPLGFGNYITQKDNRMGGRSGRLILKFGFTEQMVSASISRWFYEDSVDTGYWVGAWNSTVNDPAGLIGQLFLNGTFASVKLVNLHKGVDIPSIQTGWISKWLSSYKTPRPSVEG